MVLLEYQNIKLFLLKVTVQIGLKKFLWLTKLKILCLDLNGEESVGTFYKKKLQKTNQDELRIQNLFQLKRRQIIC